MRIKRIKFLHSIATPTNCSWCQWIRSTISESILASSFKFFSFFISQPMKHFRRRNPKLKFANDWIETPYHNISQHKTHTKFISQQKKYYSYYTCYPYSQQSIMSFGRYIKLKLRRHHFMLASQLLLINRNRFDKLRDLVKEGCQDDIGNKKINNLVPRKYEGNQRNECRKKSDIKALIQKITISNLDIHFFNSFYLIIANQKEERK